MSVKEKYGLTDEGAKNIRRGAIWTVVTNFVIFAGAGMLLMATAQLVAMLDENAAAPDPVFYLAGVAVFAIVLFIAQKNQYHSEYTTIYDESARRRIGLAERLRKLPLSFFGQRDVADLTEVMMSDVATCEHAFSDALPQLYGATITLGIAAVGLFALDWRLAAAALWSAPVAFFLLFALRGTMRPLVEAKREADLRVSDDMQEALELVREVRATNRASRFLGPIHEHLDSAERANMRGELLSGVLVNGAQAVLRLGIATTVLAGASLIAAGETGFFMFLLFLIVVSRIYAPFDQCLNYVAEIFAAQTSAARMRALYDEPLAGGSDVFEPCGHDVAFEDVSFSYGGAGGEEMLSHVTFTAKEGEVTALVGPSGSGKSTCARLAARLWDATEGRVTVGGVDVATVDPETLLRDFAVVFQDVVLFDGTVMENIRLGRRGATDEEVLAAARAANCDEFVRLMPNGYETTIGENGSLLSGGERQRVSIARALLKDAPIVLLDEATASLDVENETQVQEALSRLLAGKTVLVIAHRMRTVLNADKVVVLKDGKVFEQGRPKDLLEAGGLFRRMVDLQNASSRWSIGS